MIKIKIKDCRDEDILHIGFLTAEDEERHLQCKVYLASDNTIHLEKFMSGSIKGYKFKFWDIDKDTLYFRGCGRGRKPAWAEAAMKDFIDEVERLILGKTIVDFNG